MDVKLSARDMEALDRAQKFVQTLQDLLPENVRDTAPASVVGALLSVSLQHCDSVLILMQTGVNGASVEALMRPTIESVLRLVWVAESEQRAIQVTAKTAKFPGLSHLIQRFNPSSGREVLTRLHGLTHAGMEQLIQYFSQGDINKTQEDAAMPQMFGFFVILLAVCAGASFCSFTKRNKELERIGQVFVVTSASLFSDALKTFLDEHLKKPVPHSSLVLA